MKIKRNFLVVTLDNANGHGIVRGEGYSSEQDAMSWARRCANSANHSDYVVYQAVRLVHKTAPPVDVCYIDDEGEVT